MKLKNLFVRKNKAQESKQSDARLYPSFRRNFASSVTVDRAFTNAAFWCCVIKLSRYYASLPLHAYERRGTYNEQLPYDNLWSQLIASGKPNPKMTSYDFRFVMGLNFELYGQAVAIIERASNGLPKHLWPVAPSQILRAYDQNGTEYFKLVNGKEYRYEDVLIINNTPNGYQSVLSPMDTAMDDLELEKKCRDMQAQYYDGSSIVGNIIKVPSGWQQDKLDYVKTTFDSASGFNNFVVWDTVEVQPLQVASGDITKLQNAQAWNTKEICRRFQVPPFICGDTSATYGSSEQQGRDFVDGCIGPRCSAWEAALTTTLCPASHTRGIYYKFDLKGLMRGDHAARGAFYREGVMGGWMTVNEVRAKEEMPPVEGGDELMFPLNYGTLKDVVAGKYAPTASPWDVPLPDEPPGDDKKDEPPKEPKDPAKEGLKLVASLASMPFQSREDYYGTLSEGVDDLRAKVQEEIIRRDRLFEAEITKTAATPRRKLERIIRAQMQSEIDDLKKRIATGQPVDSVLSEWSDWLKDNAKEYQPKYVALFKDVMERMLPQIQKQTHSDRNVSETDISEFANAYTDGLLGRHRGDMKRAAKEAAEGEDLEGSIDAFKTTYPSASSAEEVNQTKNAFSVFFYGQLGLAYMHVVAGVNACSRCAALDRRICSVNGYVLKKGDDEPDADGNVVKIEKNYRHPPFHKHCDCFMAPGDGK